MHLKSQNLPKFIILIGLILTVAAYLLTSIVMKPTITEHDFDYSVTYRLNDETVTIDDVYRCTFVDVERDVDPTHRYYEGIYPGREDLYHPGQYTIDEKDGFELRIVTIFTNNHLMGDGDQFFINEIYLAAFDDMGSEYTDSETLGKFDAEIISYELPTPIENTFVFGGFSLLHDISMAAMYVVSILTVIACMIFVKRETDITYKTLDIISIVINVIISLIVTPVLLIFIYWSQIAATTDSLDYQFSLCIPAICMFVVAISLCLRRKGFTKSGFFVQFAGPVMPFILWFCGQLFTV